MALIVPVAIIIPIFNEAESLPSLLEAIRCQSCQPVEVLFVDAGSTDGSASIIENSAAKNDWGQVRVHVVTVSGSMPGQGRNYGVKATSTDWIAFLDGGIDPDKDWLEQLYQFAMVTDAPAVFGLCYFSGETDFARAVCALSYGQASTHPVIPSTLFKREVFTTIGYFPEDLRAAEDIVWIDRFLKKYGRRIVCETARSSYRHFPTNWMHVFRKWRLFEKNSVMAGVRSRQHIFYLFAIPLLYGLLFTGTYIGIILFLLYAIFRGVIDPMRRSARWQWYKGHAISAFIAVPLALWIDIAKLFGIVNAFGAQIVRSMSPKKT